RVLFRSLLEAVGVDRLAVDGDQHVAGLNSGLGGRRAFERRDDLDGAVLDAEIETDSRIVAGRADPHLFVIARGEIFRVRVELAKDAANRILDDPPLLDRVDVLVADARDDARQKLDVLGLETAGAGDRHAVRIAARVESRFALGEHRAAQRGREPEDRARREYQNAPYVQGHTRKPPLASAHISTACAKSGNLFFKSWNSVPMQGSQGSRAAVRGGRDAPP